MRPEDVRAVSGVDRLCFTLPWSEDAFAGELESPVGYYRVAELEGRIVGYIGCHAILDEAHVTTFGVHPAVRGRGIGERLLADALRHAVRSGCRRVTLEVRAGNEPALRLYRKYGFHPVSRRRRYYPDNDEDAVVMWIEDTTRMSFQSMLEERLARLEGNRCE
jgi:ribosomal-protein-alanine N-acetyltransferase